MINHERHLEQILVLAYPIKDGQLSKKSQLCACHSLCARR